MALRLPADIEAQRSPDRSGPRDTILMVPALEFCLQSVLCGRRTSMGSMSGKSQSAVAYEREEVLNKSGGERGFVSAPTAAQTS